MYPYAIGFDIGIASVGWAVVALDGEDRPFGIINMGSRVFDAAEQPKTGDSLAAPRREARSARRRLRRHQHRLERIRCLLAAENVISQAELDTLFEGQLEDIYALRVKALDAPVSNTEFARILLHIAQRRGFKSNRKSGTSKEDGELLAAVTANRALMSAKGYRTVGEMLLKDPQYSANKRNKGGKYLATVGRDMVEEEVRAIFKTQRERGQPFATAELEEQYLEILLSQRSFDEGPGQGSPYGGSQIEKMIGKCTLEPGEPRAAKASYGYKNKVLVFTEENRNKSNRLPLQYLQGKRREDFTVWVENSIRDFRKKQRLLKENITAEDEKKFKERNLQDTKTMSRFLLNYISDHLEFADFASGRKKHVTAVNGAVTSYMRKRWGITKIRENGDLHHAVDALVVACTTDGMIQQVSRYAALRECEYVQTEAGSMAVSQYTGEVLKQFPYPWPEFRRELEARLSDDPRRAVISQRFPVYANGDIPVRKLFVSRMPRRKVTGAAHKETVKSPKALKDGVVVVKRALTDLKLDPKTGEIVNYYMPQSDRLLYEALKEQLKKHGGNGAKAFAEPFHKPKSDGTPGPVVNKVKLCEPTTLNVPVLKGTGVADNDSMVRIDVFHVENDGYYFVPIYIADTLKKELPNKACVAYMLQFSVYARVCNGMDAVEKHRQRVKQNLPDNGAIRLMVITEKQYEAIDVLLGKLSEADDTFQCEQLSIF